MRSPKQRVLERYPEAVSGHDGRRAGWYVAIKQDRIDGDALVMLSHGWSTAANAWHAAWEKILSPGAEPVGRQSKRKRPKPDYSPSLAARELSRVMVNLEQQLFKAGLPATAKKINAAIQSLGWEAAGKLPTKGKKK